jgi:hypothetical protein
MMEGTNMPAILEGKVALVTGVSRDGQIVFSATGKRF